MPSPAPHRHPIRAALPALLLGAAALTGCATGARQYDPTRCPDPTFDIATAPLETSRRYSRERVAAPCVYGLTPHAKKASTNIRGERGPDVMIYPLRTVHELGPAALGQGRLVASVKMIGGEPWPAIGLRSKGDVVYVWLKATEPIDTTRTSGVVHVGTAYFVPERADSPLKTGRFLYEFHPSPNWGEAYADTRLYSDPAGGGNRDGGPNGGARGGPDGDERDLRALLESATTAGWLTCEYGCCIAEMPAS